MNRLDLVGVFALTLGGCSARAPENIGAASQPIIRTDCPYWGCGTNSAWLGENIEFHDLDASGATPNEAGLLLVGFFDSDENPLKLEVKNDHLRGWRADETAPLDGAPLQKATMRLSYRGPHGQDPETFYRLRIVDVGETVFWFPAGDARVPAYEIQFYPEGDPLKAQALCRHTKEPGWDAIQGQALIFRGDLYDSRLKTVEVTTDDNPWFNIACSGSAVAKMHLFGHTTASSYDGRVTTQPQRQAVLKMFVADYCNTGHAFTVDGHPLMYTFKQTWRPTPFPSAPYGSFEAVWNEGGATCLATPRLADQDGDGSLTGLIASECGGTRPMPCAADAPSNWTAYGYVVSENPL
jgi:hypothetical protein